MLDVLTESISRTFTIAVFVFVMMLLVDYVNVLTRGKLSTVVGKGRLRQYLSASFLGGTPGCLGGFMTVSFYVHGLISFGATLACMVSTSGDEAFVMLASFPGEALILFGVLFVLGVAFGWFADALSALFGFHYAEGCKVEVLHSQEECRCFDRELVWRQLKRVSPERAFSLIALMAATFAAAAGLLGNPAAGDSAEGPERTMVAVVAIIGGLLVATVPDHYLRTHIVGHIVREHLWKVVLWTFIALFVLEVGRQYWDIESFVRQHAALVIVMAAIIGLVPQSGPHMIFVTLFAEKAIPFSVLLTSSIVQEGHALLPLLSCSVRDALTIKGMKLILGLAIGFVLHALGW